MLSERLSVIGSEFSGDAAFAHVSKISGFHRIQASPGYRGAAQYVFGALRRFGIDAEVLTFPAKEGLTWWSQAGFMEWDCDDAELVLLEDGKRQRLCSFQEEKMSLIQRSAPTQGPIETSIVYVEDGSEDASYRGLDVAGKIVFSRGDVTTIAAAAVDRHGAAGILVDNLNEFPPVRDRMQIPDARQYTSFWPVKTAEFRAFGFVLSPRQGEALRRRFAAGGKELRAVAEVRSRFYEGAIEDVTAVIPGLTGEEVVAIAHLCHPEPSANDNASGAGALVEAARALSRLVREGRLPRPKRTIRFLWVPEMTGSYMYLAANEGRLRKFAAAINLDMVGENQDLCKGPFLVEKPPKALPGFGGDLAESVLRAMTAEAANLAGTSSNALFKWAVTPFSGGSDHYIWADPTVGVTCPMLIQWPDKYYHTSLDTIDKVDPAMLHLAGTLTATYLYFAASATPEDAAYLAGEMGAHFQSELQDALGQTMRAAREALAQAQGPEDRSLCLAKSRRAIERKADFLSMRKVLDLSSLDRLCGPSSYQDAARSRAAEYISCAAEFLKSKSLDDLAALAGLGGVRDLPPAWEPEASEIETKAASLVPTRAYKGPFAGRGHERTPEQEALQEAFSKKHKRAMRSAVYVQYWADGVRTAAEIADCVEAETGHRDIEMIVDYIELGTNLGVFR
ncbi:MAG: DUF4910 domain-containing protein [Bacillota bacterium]